MYSRGAFFISKPTEIWGDLWGRLKGKNAEGYDSLDLYPGYTVNNCITVISNDGALSVFYV